MLIQHILQVILLYAAELLVGWAAFACVCTRGLRVAGAIVLATVVLDLYLWPFYDSLTSGPERYILALDINTLALFGVLIFSTGKRADKSLILLLSVGALYAWESIDMIFNPKSSFIDSNLALLLAATYFIYFINTLGAVRYVWGNTDRSLDHAGGIFSGGHSVHNPHSKGPR